jgi:putative chitinase
MISVASLIAAGIAPTQARQFAPLAAACDRFDIDTPARESGFVAQCRVESGDFTRLEESLYYTTAQRILQVFPSHVTTIQQAQSLVRNPKGLALAVYSDRLGNGPASTGDGWTYRGRGLVQLTGRDGYQDAAVELARPYLEQPGLVAQPDDACLVAAWFWHVHHCNELADSAQWDAITRAINGRAMLQADARRAYSEDGLEAFT